MTQPMWKQALEVYWLGPERKGSRALEFVRSHGFSPAQCLAESVSFCPPDLRPIAAQWVANREEAEKMIAGFLGYR